MNIDGTYEILECKIAFPPEQECVMEFRPCREYDDYQEGLQTGTAQTNSAMDAERNACNRKKNQCTNSPNDLFTCLTLNGGNTIELTLKTDVYLPSLAEFRFSIPGYMTAVRPDEAEQPSHTWMFSTHDLDSAKSILDQQANVPPLVVLGTIYVDSIVAKGTGVSLQNNRVTVTIRLSTQVEPKAILRIAYPMSFAKDIAASTDDKVTLGDSFPQKSSWRSVENKVFLEFPEDPLLVDTLYTFVITMSNPPISPAKAENIWQIESFTATEEPDNAQDANMLIPGFRIFGNFRENSVAVASSVVSPGVQSIIGVSFQLKSTLPGGG